MIRSLIDTSAYSAFKRGRARAVESLQRADEILFSPIVLGELRAGFIKGNRQEENERELREFMGSPRVAIVTVDAETSDRYAIIVSTLERLGTPIPTNDLWIAASAMQYGLRVVTDDTHFLRVPQIVVEHLSGIEPP